MACNPELRNLQVARCSCAPFACEAAALYSEARALRDKLRVLKLLDDYEAGSGCKRRTGFNKCVTQIPVSQKCLESFALSLDLSEHKTEDTNAGAARRCFFQLYARIEPQFPRRRCVAPTFHSTINLQNMRGLHIFSCLLGAWCVLALQLWIQLFWV